jgi:hypothetical protein
LVGTRGHILLLLMVNAAVASLAAAGPASASTGSITRAEASADWTAGSFAGSASWDGCEHISCVGVTAFATVGPGSEPADCSGGGRTWPHSGEGIALVWSSGEGLGGGSASFDATEVPLSGTPEQLVCLSRRELVEERPECQTGPTVACPLWIALVPHYEVLASAVVSAAPTPPSIIGESVSGVTQHGATLEARIHPDGLETSYRFHLAYGCGIAGELCPQFCVAGQPCPGPINGPVDIPVPSGTIPASPEAESVRLALNMAGVTLLPGTRYRFSVEATNAAGTAQGPPQYFKTATQPTISGESVTDVTSDDAILRAAIDPGGLVTAYELQIDTTGQFKFDQFDSCLLHPPGLVCAEIVIPGEPLPAGLVEPPESRLAAGFGEQPVSVDLATIGGVLRPETTYHYRAIAANGPTPVIGPALTFTTSPEEPASAPPEEPAEEPEDLPEGSEAGGGDEVFLSPDTAGPGEVQNERLSPSAVAPLGSRHHRGRGQRTRRCRHAAWRVHRAGSRGRARRGRCVGIAAAVSAHG